MGESVFVVLLHSYSNGATHGNPIKYFPYRATAIEYAGMRNRLNENHEIYYDWKEVPIISEDEFKELASEIKKREDQ